MFYAISVLILIVCLLLILIVLVQNSKGGGLAANFSSSNQVMGVRKTTDFLEKATWTLAGALLFLSIMAAAFIERESGEDTRSMMQEQIDAAQDPSALPGNFPLTAPTESEETEE
ncbi:MAG: preprotein translocase subunit SecG [Salinivirgaceae bacterium]|jgi:preprotein translocase subunit SecG